MSTRNFGLEEPPKTTSFASLALELGKSESHTRQLAHSILPEQFFVMRGRAKKLLHEHRDEALQILQESSRSKVDADGEASGFKYAEERARREHYEAEYSRLKLLEKRRELLPTKDVQKSYTDAVNRTRTRLLQVPRQLCAELVGRTAGEIEKLLETGIRAALKELQTEVSGVELVTTEDDDDDI